MNLLNRCLTVTLVFVFIELTIHGYAYSEKDVLKVTVDQINVGSVLITWNKLQKFSTDQNYYEVSYCPKSKCTYDDDLKNFTKIRGHSMIVKFVIDFCNNYTINVAAKDYNEDNEKLTEGNAIFEPIPSQIENFKANSNTNDNSVTLSWNFYYCEKLNNDNYFKITLKGKNIDTQKPIAGSQTSTVKCENSNKPCEYKYTDLSHYSKYDSTVEFINPLLNKIVKNSSTQFTTASSIPKKVYDKDVKLKVKLKHNSKNQIDFTMSKDLFSNEYGKVTFYGIIIYDKKNCELDKPKYKFKKNEDWPPIFANYEKLTDIQFYFQINLKDWSDDSNEIHFSIGPNSCYNNKNNYCNQSLEQFESGIDYGLKVRAFTDSGYQESEAISLKLTFSDSTYLVLLFSIITILLICIVAGLVYLIVVENVSLKYFMTLRIKKKTLVPNDMDLQQLLSKTPQEILIEYNTLDLVLKSSSSAANNTCYAAMLPQNKIKNRYLNTLPYDYNRVILKLIDSDYINASYIKYNKCVRQYIACQGPTKDTRNDMWQMIIDQDVAAIIMLCQNKEDDKIKCEKYFPTNEKNPRVEFGDMRIEHCDELNNDNNAFTIRKFRIYYKGEFIKSVRHFQFHEWPDFDTPKEPSVLLHFRQIVQSKCKEGLLVVHCSAGVGRTGTYIALDMLLQQIETDRTQLLNVFNIVLALRQQRNNMVQTENQYEFIYRCLEEYTLSQYNIPYCSRSSTENDSSLRGLHENGTVNNEKLKLVPIR